MSSKTDQSTPTGRLVSLSDDREYELSDRTTVIGRDEGCDIVITGRQVSRRHAEIVATSNGYLLVDTSSNGTLVNGRTVEGRRELRTGDVIMCGGHQLRFVVGGESALSARPPVGAEQRLNQTMHGIPSASPPPGAEQRLSNTMHGIPIVPPARAAAQLNNTIHGVPTPSDVQDGARHRLNNAVQGMPGAPSAPRQLAAFIARTGPLAGQRFPVLTPVTNIGRAEYNDIVLPDESVSTAHAKLMRREGIWVLEDLGSTHGTSVDGHPVSGEAPLAPGSSMQVGDLVLMFEPTDDGVPAQPGGGTRITKGLSPPSAESGSTAK